MLLDPTIRFIADDLMGRVPLHGASHDPVETLFDLPVNYVFAPQLNYSRIYRLSPFSISPPPTKCLGLNVAMGVGYTYDPDEIRSQLINRSGCGIDLVACRLIVNSQELMRSQVIIAKLFALMKVPHSISKYYNII